MGPLPVSLESEPIQNGGTDKTAKTPNKSLFSFPVEVLVSREERHNDSENAVNLAES